MTMRAKKLGKYVPAAAVIRMGKRYPVTGCKGCVGGSASQM